MRDITAVMNARRLSLDVLWRHKPPKNIRNSLCFAAKGGKLFSIKFQ
jgi:hypothetical protein